MRFQDVKLSKTHPTDDKFFSIKKLYWSMHNLNYGKHYHIHDNLIVLIVPLQEVNFTQTLSK